MTEELQEPGGSGSSGCEMLTPRALRAMPTLSGWRTGCTTLGTAPVEELESKARGERAFIHPTNSLKN